jgi:hypothetical protein
MQEPREGGVQQLAMQPPSAEDFGRTLQRDAVQGYHATVRERHRRASVELEATLDADLRAFDMEAAALRIQCAQRQRAARWAVTAKRWEHAAATLLQGLCRCFRAARPLRRSWLEQRREIAAAVVLQSHFRVGLARAERRRRGALKRERTRTTNLLLARDAVNTLNSGYIAASLDEYGGGLVPAVQLQLTDAYKPRLLPPSRAPPRTAAAGGRSGLLRFGFRIAGGRVRALMQAVNAFSEGTPRAHSGVQLVTSASLASHSKVMSPRPRPPRTAASSSRSRTLATSTAGRPVRLRSYRPSTATRNPKPRYLQHITAPAPALAAQTRPATSAEATAEVKARSDIQDSSLSGTMAAARLFSASSGANGTDHATRMPIQCPVTQALRPTLPPHR